jgi:hypothetical protein
MSVPRQYILRGPCQVQFGGQVFYSKDNVVVSINPKTEAIMTDAIGKVDLRDDDVDAMCKFMPDGQVTNALLALLYPFIQAAIYPGSSVFGAADTPLTIWTRDGWKYVFPCAAVVEQPDFMAQGVKTLFGGINFRMIRANNTAWNTANNLMLAPVQAAYPGDANYNLGNIITEPFTALWTPAGFAAPTATITADSDANPDVVTTTAAHPFIPGDRVTITGVVGDNALNGTVMVATVPSATTLTFTTLAGTPIAGTGAYVSGGTITRANGFDGVFTTEAGFTISSKVNLNDEKTDDGGRIDMTFQYLDVTCKCVPVLPTPQELINLLGVQDANAMRGRSRAGLGRNLYLSGNGIYAKMPQAALTMADPIRAGAKVKRLGDVTFESTQVLAAGVPTPKLALSTAVIA